MKRKLIALILVALSVGGLKAQTQFKPEWNIGVGFGPTFSNMSFIPFVGSNPETKNKLQYHGGIAVRYVTEKNVGLIAELNYSQQGWQGEFKDNPEYEHSHSLTYLELPILTHIYFGNKVRFFVNMGPKVQFLVKEKEILNKAFADHIVNNQKLNDVTLHYNRNAENKFDYGILLGGGLEFRTGIGNFALEGRYYFGLNDIYDSKKNDENFSRSANRVLSAKLTYFVKLF